jgi:hypothetical protein
MKFTSGVEAYQPYPAMTFFVFNTRELHRQSVFGLASCWLWFSSVGYRSV